jgi:hypothetical protein
VSKRSEEILEHLYPEITYVYLVRSRTRIAKRGGIPDDDTALFSTYDAAISYAEKHIGAATSGDSASISIYPVAVDITEPDAHEGTASCYDYYEFELGKATIKHFHEPEDPVCYPFATRFKRGDFVWLKDTWMGVEGDLPTDPETRNVVPFLGVVMEPADTKWMWLKKNPGILDPATTPPDPQDLLVPQSVVELIPDDFDDIPDLPGIVTRFIANECKVYFIRPCGLLEHEHAGESNLELFDGPLPDSHLILGVLRQIALESVVLSDNDWKAVDNYGGDVRNVTRFDFETLSFRTPMRLGQKT